MSITRRLKGPKPEPGYDVQRRFTWVDRYTDQPFLEKFQSRSFNPRSAQTLRGLHADILVLICQPGDQDDRSAFGRLTSAIENGKICFHTLGISAQAYRQFAVGFGET